MRNILIFFIVIFLVISCRKIDTDKPVSIIVKNGNNFPIYYKFSWCHPDTTLPVYDPSNDRYNHYLKAHSEKAIKVRKWYYWRDLFKDSNVEYFYIFNADSVDQKGWEYIRHNYSIMSRIPIDMRYLDEHNWIISTPSD